MIIDGGPRRNMNTAAMVEAFADGARSEGAEVKHIRLYDIDYKGCRSVMACNTVQVNDYSRFDFSEGTAKNKKAYRDAHWEEDLAKAREAGERMARTNE